LLEPVVTIGTAYPRFSQLYQLSFCYISLETCNIVTKNCNCDQNAGPETFDDGYLDDKAKLPVTEMWFGDTEDLMEKGWHTLGKLECFGEG